MRFIAQLGAGLPKGGSLPLHVFRRRHRGVLLLLWAHLPALCAFAVLRGYGLLHGLVEVGVVGTPVVLATLAQHQRRGVQHCVRVDGADDGVGGSRPPLRRRNRSALPLLRHGGRRRALSGVDTFPRGHRLRRAASRSDGVALSARGFRQRRRVATPHDLGGPARRGDTRHERGRHRELEHQRTPPTATARRSMRHWPQLWSRLRTASS